MHALFAGDLEQVSRREFLRRARAGSLSLLLLAFLKERPPTREDFGAEGALPSAGTLDLGRVLENSVGVYQEPSFDAKLVNMYWRDLVYPINATVVGDAKPEHNRIWYRINDEGYAHSGKVQPVTVRRAAPVDSIPKEGLLGELCVPFTDARWDPDRPDRFAARLYFSTTYWITGIKKDRQGAPWYKVLEDKKSKYYYVNAAHLRVISAEELAPLSPDVPADLKRIEVRLGEQMVVAYEDSRPVLVTRAATGGNFIDGNYSTPLGRFMTNRKRPSRHMASGDLAAANAYDLPGVPWVSYLTLKGVSFHGTYWHNDFGRPRSHGCINLTSEAARWIYCWTLPGVPAGKRILEVDEGTRVDVIE